MACTWLRVKQARRSWDSFQQEERAIFHRARTAAMPGRITLSPQRMTNPARHSSLISRASRYVHARQSNRYR